jgi:hypothetical protein
MTLAKSELRRDDRSPAHVPGVSVNRRAFMNSIVALPIVAALPVAAPAMTPAAAAEQSADPIFAAIDAYRQADAAFDAVPRDDEIPDVIGERHSDAFRLVLRTRPTTPAGLAALTTWTRERMDWLRTQGSNLFAEDLCTLTATIDDAARGMSGLEPWSSSSPAATIEPHPDAELLSLAAKYVATEAEHSRLYKLYTELEDAFLNEGMPEALRVRPGDAEFGIHAFFGRLGKDHNYFNIDVLRWPKWPHPDSKVEFERGRIVAERLFEPSAEARARADEIIAANDQWQKTKGKKKPRRLVAIDRKRAQLVKLMNELDERITEMPATTMEGMVAKAQCAKVYDEDCRPDCDDPLSMFGASIVRDLLARAAPKLAGA